MVWPASLNRTRNCFPNFCGACPPESFSSSHGILGLRHALIKGVSEGRQLPATKNPAFRGIEAGGHLPKVIIRLKAVVDTDPWVTAGIPGSIAGRAAIWVWKRSGSP